MKKFVIALVCLFSAAFLFAGEHGKSCNMKEKQAAAAKSVEMTGKILCKHCDLKQSEQCEKVFQSSSDEKTLYKICDASKVDVEKLGEDKGVYKVKGKLVTCEKDGKEEFMIEEATKIETSNI